MASLSSKAFNSPLFPRKRSIVVGRLRDIVDNYKQECIAKGKGLMVSWKLPEINKSNIEICKTHFPVQYQDLMATYKLACDHYQNTHAGETYEFSFENAMLWGGPKFQLTISAKNVSKGYVETIEAVGLVTIGVKVELLSCEPKISHN